MKDYQATRIKHCVRCGRLADYETTIDEKIIEGYYEDADGNLQMTMTTKTVLIDVCNEHLPFYLDKGYNIVGKYINRGKISHE